nr:MAG TPA: hypothetical protein [Herelleviridae sp.]
MTNSSFYGIIIISLQKGEFLFCCIIKKSTGNQVLITYSGLLGMV